MNTIDVRSPLPKYQQLRGTLLEELTQSKIGQRFYSENEIAKMFSISPLTARKALSILEEEGFLRREQGVGTFVESFPKTPRKLKVIEDCSIGILIGEVEQGDNIAFQKVLLGTEGEALKRGYLLQIAQLSTTNHLPKMIAGSHIDGLLIIGQINAETARQLKGLPTVSIGNVPTYNFHNIASDGRMAGYQVAKYFLSLGHKKIGLVAGSSHSARLSSNILAGFREALSENAGLFDFDEKFIRVDPEKSDYILTKQILESEQEVTALFLGSWLGVAQSLQVISEKGLKIPEDLSVVSYGDNILAMYTNPALTTVKLFSEEVGKKSVELLLNVIKDPAGTPKKTYYRTKIVERDSCCALS
jgi:LacI family transcriptional regulator